MGGKKSALNTGIDEYFLKLRGNLVFAELALMQFAPISRRLESPDCLGDELRLNLEVHAQALRELLVLSIARLFDPKGSHQDQLSIPNLLESKIIALTDSQRQQICRLMALPVVKDIKGIRDQMVAHSTTQAPEKILQSKDILYLIDECYSLLAAIYSHNKPSERLERKDISKHSEKWKQMIESWV